MNPVAYVRPMDVDEALAAIGRPVDSSTAMGDARFIAGGTNLTDLMKLHVMRPDRLVDVNRLDLARIAPGADGGLVLGALARNADTAYHPLVRRRYPLLSSAILAGASPQIRNMATDGGNLLQRTRCYYFYDLGTPCNKRQPGSGCSAIGGLTRQHAILGASPQCIATHPSDMCVALAALDARVHVASARGSRVIAFADFHRLPGDRPDLDNTLAQDELIAHLSLPDSDRFAAHSVYLKLRDRLSYAFALVSVAVALELHGDGRIREARLALGGVAHKPWRRPEAEALRADATPGDGIYSQAADALLDGAVGQGANDFKIVLARRAIVRALKVAHAGTVGNARRDHGLQDGGAGP